MKARSNARNFSKEEIDNFLKEQRVGLLSLSDEQSSYAVPLAYSYDDDTVFLTLGPQGRKMDYIGKNKNVCFSVYWVHEGYSQGKRAWKSVICDGELEHITNPENITRGARVLEKHMGMPEGALNNILEMTLKDPSKSNFWQINVKNFGGRGVEDFEETFEE